MNERTKIMLDEIIHHVRDQECHYPEHLLKIIQKHGGHLILTPLSFGKIGGSSRPTYETGHQATHRFDVTGDGKRIVTS